MGDAAGAPLALKETERLSRKANLVFERCDVLLTPATARAMS